MRGRKVEEDKILEDRTSNERKDRARGGTGVDIERRRTRKRITNELVLLLSTPKSQAQPKPLARLLRLARLAQTSKCDRRIDCSRASKRAKTGPSSIKAYGLREDEQSLGGRVISVRPPMRRRESIGQTKAKAKDDRRGRGRAKLASIL
uniref:Uncharacterized protein n=1 Tax=Agrocybe chaxingu TaxID=84603 RepID=A0A9W8MPC8_9AGAR|nr:hypothetical protein NLJ89_g12131 [Agrocybe chaxingu]